MVVVANIHKRDKSWIVIDWFVAAAETRKRKRFFRAGSAMNGGIEIVFFLTTLRDRRAGIT